MSYIFEAIAVIISINSDRMERGIVGRDWWFLMTINARSATGYGKRQPK